MTRKAYKHVRHNGRLEAAEKTLSFFKFISGPRIRIHFLRIAVFLNVDPDPAA